MKHPLRTLLRELFVDPILRLLRIRRREQQETVVKGQRAMAHDLDADDPGQIPMPCRIESAPIGALWNDT
jgi:hypothetical protein